MTEQKGTIYTYVGKGESSPELINFCGMQEFLRGEPTEVVNLAVLAKLENHPCFVKGEADKRTIAERDREAVKEVAEKRKLDAKIQAAAVKKHK